MIRDAFAFAVRSVALAFTILCLAILTIALLTVGSVRHGDLGGETVRARASDSLSRLAGPGRQVEIGDLGVRFGQEGVAAIVLRGVVVSDEASGLRTTIGQIAMRLRALPLLRGRIEAQTLIVRDTSIDIAPLLTSRDQVDWVARAEKFSVENGLRSLGAGLFRAENAMRRSGLHTVLLSNVRIAGFDKLPLKADRAIVKRLRLERDARYTEGLRAEGTVQIGARDVAIVGSWEAEGGRVEGRTLRATANGFHLSEIPRMLTKGEAPLEISAPTRLTARVPFADDHSPRRSFLTVEVKPGLIWFGDKEPTRLSEITVNLRADPKRNSVALLPSRFASESVEGALAGGFAKVSGPAFEYEFATEGLRSRAGGVDRFYPGGWSIGGRFDANAKRLEVSQLRFLARGGGLKGSGAFDMTGWTPGIRFEAATERMGIETLKAHWPPFVAWKLRKWAVGGAVVDGELVDATLSADIPVGVIGGLRKGGTLGPAELSLTLPVRGVTLRTAGDLPPVTDASGTVRVAGVSVVGTLTRGTGRVPGGRAVDLAGSSVAIPDFLTKGLPAQLQVKADGKARDLLKLASTKPLKIGQAIGIAAKDASGDARLIADVETPLVFKNGAKPTDWSARLDIRKGGLTRPFKGRKIRGADLAIVARPGQVAVDGTATIDGVKARLALVEPFGPGARARASSRVAMRMNARERKAVGIDLDGYLSGPVDVQLRSVGDGWQAADVDLRKAVIDLSFMDWRKGKGVPGRASFRFRTRDGRTEISRLKLIGKGFSAAGNMIVDRKGLRSAVMDQVSLNGKDRLSLDAVRTKRGYRIAARSADYDVRSLVRALLDTSKSGANGKARKRRQVLEIDGLFDRLRGFGGETISAVRVSTRLIDGQPASLQFRGVSRKNAPVAVVMKPAGDVTQVRIDASDAGSLLRFADLYAKMQGGQLKARMKRDGDGIYSGNVRARDFTLVGEPKLKSLIADTRQASSEDRTSPALRQLRAGTVKIKEARAYLRSGKGSLVAKRGRLRGGDMAATFEGTIYDAAGRMRLKGTFLPAYGLNRMVSSIPFVGLATGNGRKRGLLGITFRLSGPWRQPGLEVNPLSILAPGVFRKIFE